ncbi:MAG TPA: alpha/beta hydrolase [Aliidongia sp.]|uniref:alpha/beta hydrolase n=1 Tax=Aliidongia sp. TaxID=1914230 RepID=UPI002DDD11B4|nr:alpha/beta hydrolase [Aliidongia sp.]HEV2678528.1 alpha/beta hydrolase [Aliidongia sp.]
MLKWFVIVVSALYLLALTALTIGQRRFLYFPAGVPVPPAEAGLPRGRSVTITTVDGEHLLAWYVPPREGRPLLLYFHGNGGSLAGRAQRFGVLTATGDGLLAVEYRGYPGSSGTATEAGLHRDAEAAYRYAIGLDIPPSRLVIMGESLGTRLAVALAARHASAALVLDSPYSSVADVAAAQFWMFPVRLVLWDQFRSDRRIGEVTVPVLMVHGSADQVIPLPFAEKLYALAHEPKRFIRVDGAGHLAMGSVLPQVLDWIDRIVR